MIMEKYIVFTWEPLLDDGRGGLDHIHSSHMSLAEAQQVCTDVKAEDFKRGGNPVAYVVDRDTWERIYTEPEHEQTAPAVPFNAVREYWECWAWYSAYLERAPWQGWTAADAARHLAVMTQYFYVMRVLWEENGANVWQTEPDARPTVSGDLRDATDWASRRMAAFSSMEHPVYQAYAALVAALQAVLPMAETQHEQGQDMQRHRCLYTPLIMRVKTYLLSQIPRTAWDVSLCLGCFSKMTAPLAKGFNHPRYILGMRVSIVWTANKCFFAEGA